MIDALFNGLTLFEHHGDIHRNIASLRITEDLFDDLTDSAKGISAAIELELASKPHTYTSNQPTIHRPYEEAQYCDAIEYPFKHWTKTRYSDGSFGVWYGADTLETSIFETVHHWRYGFLEDAGWQNLEGMVIERKVYFVRCDTALLNFIPKLTEFPALIDPISYHLTQQIGTRIHHDGHPGILNRSARCDGNVYAIFNKQVLSNPRQQCYLSYRISAGQVLIERQPDELIMQI